MTVSLAPPAVRPRRPPSAVLRLVLVAGGLAVVGLWWLDTRSATLTGPGAWWMAVGRVAGLSAAYLVLVQVMLMARIPWFERSVGLDRLAGWHRVLGTGVLTLIAAHILTICWGYSLADHRSLVHQSWTIVATYPDMVLATIGTGLFVVVGVSSGRWMRQHLPYEAWYLLHLGAYLAVALTVLHQLSNGTDFVNHPAYKALWILLYVAVAGSVVWWRALVPLRSWSRHQLRIGHVVRESDDVVSVWVRGRQLRRLRARPGQFFLWRFATRGHLVSAHPYSLSAAPTDRWLRITVRNAGDHSAALARLRPGTPVLAEGPFGSFTEDRRTRRRVLLIAGGSGIGPIRALAEGIARRDPGADLTLLYRVRRPEDLALASELEAMRADGVLTVHYLVGSRRELGHDPLAASRLLGLVPDVVWRDVFVCGPEGMTASTELALHTIGVPRGQIHTEEFALR